MSEVKTEVTDLLGVDIVVTTWRRAAGPGELWIGDYLVNGNLGPGLIMITHRSGEGGAYDEKKLEALLRAFVAENF